MWRNPRDGNQSPVIRPGPPHRGLRTGLPQNELQGRWRGSVLRRFIADARPACRNSSPLMRLASAHAGNTRHRPVLHVGRTYSTCAEWAIRPGGSRRQIAPLQSAPDGVGFDLAGVASDFARPTVAAAWCCRASSPLPQATSLITISPRADVSSAWRTSCTLGPANKRF